MSGAVSPDTRISALWPGAWDNATVFLGLFVGQLSPAQLGSAQLSAAMPGQAQHCRNVEQQVVLSQVGGSPHLAIACCAGGAWILVPVPPEPSSLWLHPGAESLVPS